MFIKKEKLLCWPVNVGVVIFHTVALKVCQQCKFLFMKGNCSAKCEV